MRTYANSSVESSTGFADPQSHKFNPKIPTPKSSCFAVSLKLSTSVAGGGNADLSEQELRQAIARLKHLAGAHAGNFRFLKPPRRGGTRPP